MNKIMKRNLRDTPFSIDRLFVWGVGIVMIVGMVGMVMIAYQARDIPPQLQSAVMFCIGAFTARIEKGIQP